MSNAPAFELSFAAMETSFSNIHRAILPYFAGLINIKAMYKKKEQKMDQKMYDWILELHQFLSELLPKMAEICDAKSEKVDEPGSEQVEVDDEKEKEKKRLVFKSFIDMFRSITSNPVWFYGKMSIVGGQMVREKPHGIDLQTKLVKFGNWLQENTPNSTLLANTFADMVVGKPGDMSDEMTYRLFNVIEAISRYNRESTDHLDVFTALVVDCKRQRKNVNKYIKEWLMDGTKTSQWLKEHILNEIKRILKSEPCILDFEPIVDFACFPLPKEHLFDVFSQCIIPLVKDDSLVVASACADYFNSSINIWTDCYLTFFTWWMRNKDASGKMIMDEFSRVVTFLNPNVRYNDSTLSFYDPERTKDERVSPSQPEFQISFQPGASLIAYQHNRFLLSTLSMHFIIRSKNGANSLLYPLRVGAQVTGDYIKKICDRIVGCLDPKKTSILYKFINHWLIMPSVRASDLEDTYKKCVTEIEDLDFVVYTDIRANVHKKTVPVEQHYTFARISKFEPGATYARK